MQALKEGNVRVSVDRVHDNAAAGEARLDIPYERFETHLTEIDVELPGNLSPEGSDLPADDRVGGARIDIVRTSQDETPPPVLEQPCDRRARLLVGSRAGVQDVGGALFPLVLDRIEEQVVASLENRDHGLSARRRPSAEHDLDPVLIDHPGQTRREDRWVRLPVFLDRNDPQPGVSDLDSSHVVDLSNGEELCLCDRVFRKSECPGSGVENTNAHVPVERRYIRVTAAAGC